MSDKASKAQLKRIKSVIENLRAHNNDLKRLKKDVHEVFKSISIWLKKIPQDTLTVFVTEHTMEILAQFVDCHEINENERHEAVFALCLMLKRDIHLKLDIVDRNFRNLLIKGLSQPTIRPTIATAINESASVSEKFRKDIKNDGIEEKIVDLALVLRNNEVCSEVIQMIGAIYNPTKSYYLFQETKKMRKVDFIHAVLWMLNERLQYTVVINGGATLETYMPILTEALWQDPDCEGKVAGMACLVLRHFFVHDFNSCAERVIRADLVPHIVNLLSCSNVTVILQTLKCIAYMGRNQRLCKLFIGMGIIARLREKIDTNSVSARIFGPVCFAFKGISDGLPQEDLHLIPLDVLRRVGSLSNVSPTQNVTKIANFFLDSVKKRLPDGLF